MINRLSGGVPPKPAQPASAPTVDREKIATIKTELLRVSSLSAQTRGFAFEGFLKSLCDAFGLAAQEQFRLRGEQIDGNFQLSSDTYLLEAKWHGQPNGVADLHTFHGKFEQKAAWTGSGSIRGIAGGKSTGVCLSPSTQASTMSDYSRIM